MSSSLSLTEGKYPFLNKEKVWGSLEDLIVKSKEEQNERNLIISKHFVEKDYTPTSGNPRKMKLEMIKLRDKTRNYNYYTTIAENRNLVTLCKMVDKRNSTGSLYVSRDDYKIHFKVTQHFSSCSALH